MCAHGVVNIVYQSCIYIECAKHTHCTLNTELGIMSVDKSVVR
jgi:hypothetical protein